MKAVPTSQQLSSFRTHPQRHISMTSIYLQLVAWALSFQFSIISALGWWRAGGGRRALLLGQQCALSSRPRPQTTQFSLSGGGICLEHEEENETPASLESHFILGSPQFKSLSELKVLQVPKMSDILIFKIKYKWFYGYLGYGLL